MYIDPNKYPSGMLVNDPTTVINTIPGSTFSSTLGNTPFNDPWENPMKEIEERIKKLETDNKFLRLKILSMEGKFTQEEVINIRKMLIAEDESSRTLTESIIENA
jgi:hypothetical protein